MYFYNSSREILSETLTAKYDDVSQNTLKLKS